MLLLLFLKPFKNKYSETYLNIIIEALISLALLVIVCTTFPIFNSETKLILGKVTCIILCTAIGINMIGVNMVMIYNIYLFFRNCIAKRRQLIIRTTTTMNVS